MRAWTAKGGCDYSSHGGGVRQRSDYSLCIDANPCAHPRDNGNVYCGVDAVGDDVAVVAGEGWIGDGVPRDSGDGEGI
jgi:hypothetical protein